LEVALRAGQSDMSEIRGQEWQLGAKVDILFTPQQKPKTRKGMTQVMEPNAAVSCPFDAGDPQRVMKRAAERGDGIPTPARAGEQGCIRATGPVALRRSDAALNNAVDQIRCEWYHARFVEFAVMDMQGASIEIEVSLRNPEWFSSSQPSQVEKTQRGAKTSRTYGRPLPRRQLGTGLQETAALISAEHARHKLLSHDP
jgi:hypothetical protein